MSPRRSAAEADRTRAALVERATDLASTDGLEGVTIGRLAEATGLSKSGVTRHFPAKVELQLETLAHANARFERVVWAPAAGCTPGLERLRAICRSWTAFLAGDTFPGGCFLSAASAEFDGRSGPVRDEVARSLSRWLRVLEREAATAIAGGELPESADARGIAYQLNALAVGANQARQLLGDEEAPARSLALMLEVLGG